MPKDSRTQVPGRLIIKYLQENEAGATVSDVVHHLRDEHGASCGQPAADLTETVKSILADGATLGFLEKQGPKFMYWVGREVCGCRRRRRRRRSRCRRRRSRRRRSRSRRRRSCRRRRVRRCGRRRRRPKCRCG